jgi:hypothetical protein
VGIDAAIDPERSRDLPTPTAFRALALSVLLLTAGRAEAQSYFAPTSGQLLAEAQIYTEANIGGDFEAFVEGYAPSTRLEAAIWELTADSDTLARLADLFGWSDPWKYRRAVAQDHGANRD